MVISRCEDCNHRNICKYKDEYDKVIREVNVKVPEPFTLTLNCSHYYCTTAYLNTNSAEYSNWTTACNNSLSSHYR